MQSAKIKVTGGDEDAPEVDNDRRERSNRPLRDNIRSAAAAEPDGRDAPDRRYDDDHYEKHEVEGDHLPTPAAHEAPTSDKRAAEIAMLGQSDGREDPDSGDGDRRNGNVEPQSAE